MLNSDEKLVSEVVSSRGLHTAKIIRFARPVDEEAWIERLIPDYARSTYTFWDDVEDPGGLNCHLLFLHWKERGAVDFREIKEVQEGAGASPARTPSVGVLWWIAPGESLSFSADVAATVHKRSFGCMPSVAWVRKLPAKAQKAIEVGEGDDHVMLELKTGDWVPERFVVVGVPG
jgi:hypothetical protein